jgi:hypothetical protein
MHEFVFKIKGQLVTVNKWEDVPQQFDHVIKFVPDIPPDPHTEEQHEEISLWNARLQQLMEIERNARNNS